MRRFFFFIFILILAAAAYLAYGLLLPAGSSQQKFVLLKPGTSAHHIAQQLEAQGVIRSWPAFLLLHYWRVQPLKAGEYLFDHPANGVEVYDRLARGDIYAHTVVVPEGYNLFEIAAAIEAAGLGPQEQFIEAARDPSSIRDLDPQAQSLEGYLFPDTYQFTRTQSAHDMATMMVHRFRQEARKLGLTSDVHRTVTMASIIEKETAAQEERPLVASVYYNRLQRRMPLDADPTVIYAAMLEGRYRGAIYQSDLASNSAYNTYKVAGLPPGPIANPGEASLTAAMHPAQSNYLYFVSDNNGHHRFAATAEEHARNVALYRRLTAGH